MTALYLTETGLFLGCSLRDPDLLYFLDSIAGAFGTPVSDHYALMPESERGALDRRALSRDYRIHVLPYVPSPGHTEVLQFLQALRSRVSELRLERSTVQATLGHVDPRQDEAWDAAGLLALSFALTGQTSLRVSKTEPHTIGAVAIDPKNLELALRRIPFVERGGSGGYRFTSDSDRDYCLARFLLRTLRGTGSLLPPLGPEASRTGWRLYRRSLFRHLAQVLQAHDRQPLLKALSSSNSWERLAASYLLGKLNGAHQRASSIDALEAVHQVEQQALVRREMAIALARLGRPQALEAWVAYLMRNQTEREAIYDLAYFWYHDEQGGPLREVSWRLESNFDTPMRVEYVSFLGDYGDATTIPTIVRYADDEREAVRDQVQDAVRRITERDPQNPEMRLSTPLRARYERKCGILRYLTDFPKDALTASRVLFSIRGNKVVPRQFDVWTFVVGLPLPVSLTREFVKLVEQIDAGLPAHVRRYWVQPENLHWEVFIVQRPGETITPAQIGQATVAGEVVFGRTRPFDINYKGFAACMDGTIMALGYGEFDRLRKSLREAVPYGSARQSELGHISLGRILDPVGQPAFRRLHDLAAERTDYLFGELPVRAVKFVHETQWYMENRHVHSVLPLSD